MLLRILPVLALLTLPAAHAQAPPPAIEEAILVPDFVTGNEVMGRAVAYDGNRIVVSAPASRIPGPRSGAVFVYQRQGSTWVQTARLLSPDPENGEEFGRSLALDGDRIVVGAPNDYEPAGETYGAAFVFDFDGSEWQMTKRLTEAIPTNAENANYGRTVAIQGDRVFVGASQEEADGRQGAVYVHLFDGAGWVREARLISSVTGEMFFGASLSVSGDRVLIGAPGTSQSTQQGAYVFRRNGASWTQESRLLPFDPEVGSGFGNSVSLDGDLALVGASSQDALAVNSGAAYVFERSGTTWGRSAELTAASGPDGYFGSDVVLAGTVAVIGAAGVDSATGRVYVFERADGTWEQREVVFASDGAEGDVFGNSVAYQDGRMVVGAQYRSSDDGAAYVFGSVLVDNEDAPQTGAAALSAPMPNPSRDQARLTLTIEAPQTIRAVLLDALGRQVATLFDGTAVGETEIRVDTSVLPAGVYAVRATGETVAATRRLTVVR